MADYALQMASGAISILQTSFANDDHGADPWSFYIKVCPDPETPAPTVSAAKCGVAMPGHHVWPSRVAITCGHHLGGAQTTSGRIVTKIGTKGNSHDNLLAALRLTPTALPPDYGLACFCGRAAVSLSIDARFSPFRPFLPDPPVQAVALQVGHGRYTFADVIRRCSGRRAAHATHITISSITASTLCTRTRTRYTE